MNETSERTDSECSTIQRNNSHRTKSKRCAATATKVSFCLLQLTRRSTGPSVAHKHTLASTHTITRTPAHSQFPSLAGICAVWKEPVFLSTHICSFRLHLFFFLRLVRSSLSDSSLIDVRATKHMRFDRFVRVCECMRLPLYTPMFENMFGRFIFEIVEAWLRTRLRRRCASDAIYIKRNAWKIRGVSSHRGGVLYYVRFWQIISFFSGSRGLFNVLRTRLRRCRLSRIVLRPAKMIAELVTCVCVWVWLSCGNK